MPINQGLLRAQKESYRNRQHFHCLRHRAENASTACAVVCTIGYCGPRLCFCSFVINCAVLMQNMRAPSLAQMVMRVRACQITVCLYKWVGLLCLFVRVCAACARITQAAGASQANIYRLAARSSNRAMLDGYLDRTSARLQTFIGRVEDEEQFSCCHPNELHGRYNQAVTESMNAADLVRLHVAMGASL